MPCRATQDRRVILEGSDKCGALENGMANHFSILVLRTHEQYEKAKKQDTEEMEIPDHLTCLLRNLYAGQEAAVRTGHGTTDWFQIGK